MNITINGKKTNTTSSTIANLVAELGINIRQVAVERNGEIVPKSAYDNVAIVENDVIEVVAFVGGG